MSMLTPELKKLREHLEGARKGVDKERLLSELCELDDNDMKPLLESLAQANTVCPACGREL